MGSFSSASHAKSFVAAGTVSVVYAVDENRVIKTRPSSGDFERRAYVVEIRSYERLGYHERIASYEVVEEGLLLERGTCLRKMLQSARSSTIPQAMKLQWAREAAEGLAYIHSRGVIHADVGCHNIIVDHANHVKFIDFAGSGIDGEAPLVCYEWCSFRPGMEIGTGTDIFAFGSMLFELETGNVPYHELEGTMEMGALVTVVEGLFSQQQFPSLKGLVYGDVVSGCWDGRYTSMDEVYRDIACCCDGPNVVQKPGPGWCSK
ncbi:kinase-like protein [Aspergillus steynii IBT 23096]|uniref:Kinase-like protein n=1 Tax=Aspergillus steynii IBT 23096 TaxID=1392250 RepID=A0A2I2FY55_9EURO|nr:kinase-like protein [Aspergillus steynii IBT 23096]PLB45567.1 kinase-like protein [Aspergillus steynii IBT 23096]